MNPKLLSVSLVIPPHSSKVVLAMITRLLAFIQKKVIAKTEKVDARLIAIMRGKKEDPPGVINPEFMAVADEEYSEFLGIFIYAIDQLDKQAEPEAFGAPDDLGVDIAATELSEADSIGYGLRSLFPLRELSVVSMGRGDKRVSESEKNSEPARKRTKTGSSSTLQTLSHNND